MHTNSTSTCPFCHGSQVSYYLSCQDYLASGELFELYLCHTCQLIYTNRAPSPKQMDAYYESQEYISHTNTAKGLINKLYHLVRTYMLSSKAALVEKQNLNQQGKLLDIGAGIGLFSQTMKKRNWDVIGIEPSSYARAYASAHLNFELHKESYWVNIKNKSMDVVTLWHVLEHIPNLHEVLTKINLVLKDRGKLILAVPNPDSYDAKKYKQDWAAYDVPRHLWHFKPAALSTLLQKYSFELKEVKRMPFDAFYISMMSEKNKGSKLAILRGFWSGCIGAYKSIFNKRASSSLIYILEKKF